MCRIAWVICNRHACARKNTFLAKMRAIVVARKCVDFYTLRDYSFNRGSVLQKQADLACTQRSKLKQRYSGGNRQTLSCAQAWRDRAHKVGVYPGDKRLLFCKL